MMNENIPVIVGPTGVGKTAAAITLAQENLFEIISADSRQVYRGMDIATGKETDKGSWQMVNGRRTLVVEGVNIHGLDMVEPDQPFSVADWYHLVEELSKEITQRNHQPLMVGGTGFYLDALAGRIDSLDVPPNLELRQELDRLSAEALRQRLSRVDPDRLAGMNDSDQQNPARLVRAIELGLSVKRQASSYQKVHDNTKPHNLQPTTYSPKLIGLTMPRQQLLERADRRIEEMVEQGLVEETRRLVEQYGTEIPSMSGIGYREIGRYLRGEIELDEAVELIKTRTHQYIKRQYTWFNHRPVEWVDAEQPGWVDELATLVNKY